MYVKTLVSTAGAAFTFSFSFVFLAWLTASKVEGFPMIVFFHTVFMLSSVYILVIAIPIKLLLVRIKCRTFFPACVFAFASGYFIDPGLTFQEKLPFILCAVLSAIMFERLFDRCYGHVD